MRHPVQPLIVLLALAAVACGPPRVRIPRVSPAAFAVEQGQKFALRVEPEPSAPAAERAVNAVAALTRGQLLTAETTLDAVRGGLSRQLTHSPFGIAEGAQAAFVLKVVPTEWNFEMDKGIELRGTDLRRAELRTNLNPHGGVGRLQARFEVRRADAPDAPPVYSQTFSARAKVADEGELGAMTRASEALADAFVAALAPSWTLSEVELDDGDPVVGPGIELSKRGNVGAARFAFEDAVSRAPGSPAALYNLGVFVEAEGDYRRAEDLFERAVRINPKRIYTQALDRVRARNQSAQESSDS